MARSPQSLRFSAADLALTGIRTRADALFRSTLGASAAPGKKFAPSQCSASGVSRRSWSTAAAGQRYSSLRHVAAALGGARRSSRQWFSDDRKTEGRSQGAKNAGNDQRYYSFAAAGGLGSVLLLGAPVFDGDRRPGSSVEPQDDARCPSLTNARSSFLFSFGSSPSRLASLPVSRGLSQQPALCQTQPAGEQAKAVGSAQEVEEACHHESPLWRSEENRPFERKLGDALLFCGNSNEPLARAVADRLSTTLGKAAVKRFADGEVNIQFSDSLRGKDVYIIQPTSTPVNENLVELLLMISTCRRASAKKITAVIPYYGYARQDRKLSSRVPISAADVARMIEAMGVDRVVAVDLHCGQIQGFFGPRVPVDNLEAQIIGLEYFHHKNLQKPVVVSPDAGGVYRARKFQEGLIARGYTDCGIAMLIKQRIRANEIERMDLVGSVAGSDVIIVDDMIDTAGTLCEAARELRKKGARRVFAFATHGLFSGPAIERIEASPLEEVVVTDSIKARPEVAQCTRITSLSISVLLADAIRRIHQKESLNDLFNVKY
ncbi:phosphoribosylpyrophosphate synthetase [Besnoitia besnoiti]|uniref:ribose-phosphate diphosphokinase n=1 Tax=Besnoitia besnoiti TaxID=94643 RepID=A0A2A9MA48_BESBE|nr:phosphoribosylpyrophosphate synthetase [Besnoitia besnoiti]PFH32250.1 phosphoribosylpyrophosphate synthetase [Besnoitia besnoiti]